MCYSIHDECVDVVFEKEDGDSKRKCTSLLPPKMAEDENWCYVDTNELLVKLVSSFTKKRAMCPCVATDPK